MKCRLAQKQTNSSLKASGVLWGLRRKVSDPAMDTPDPVLKVWTDSRADERSEERTFQETARKDFRKEI